MQEIYKRALLLIHKIEVFNDEDHSDRGIIIYFNSIKKKFFGSGYKVVEAGPLCLSLDYVEGALSLTNIDIFGSQEAYFITDESFLNKYPLVPMSMGKILMVAKNSDHATGKIKDELNRLFKEFTEDPSSPFTYSR